MRRSGWTYNARFRDLCAAQKWGCASPGAFDTLPKSERVDIVAWYEASWRIDAVDGFEASRPRAKARRRRK